MYGPRNWNFLNTFSSRGWLRDAGILSKTVGEGVHSQFVLHDPQQGCDGDHGVLYNMAGSPISRGHSQLPLSCKALGLTTFLQGLWDQTTGHAN